MKADDLCSSAWMHRHEFMEISWRSMEADRRKLVVYLPRKTRGACTMSQRASTVTRGPKDTAAVDPTNLAVEVMIGQNGRKTCILSGGEEGSV